MKYCVIDTHINVETGDIECFSYNLMKDKKKLSSGNIIEPKDIKQFLLSQKIIVGHDILHNKIPYLEKALEINLNKTQIYDTKIINWYQSPHKKFNHGSNEWREYLKNQEKT